MPLNNLAMNAKDFLEKNKIAAGNEVIAKKKGTEYKGIIVNAEGDTLILKLGSGYNIGLNAGEIEAIAKTGEEKKIGKAEAKKIGNKKGLPEIVVLHTGGTIASRVDYRTGGVVSSFEPEDLNSMFPEISKIANIKSRLIANMWSDDLRFHHFTKIAKAIEEEIRKGCEGIIIGIGTDNLAVAAAAISFAIEKTPVPIIFTGAQRSSDRGSSDAAMNMICAAQFIAKTDFAGAAICMHSTGSDDYCNILPATKTRKMHSSARDAFKAINDTPIAAVNYATGETEFIARDYAKKDKNNRIIVKPVFEEKVALLKIHVNMFAEQFEVYRKHDYKGIVIEGTGLGHTPGHAPDEQSKENVKILGEIRKLSTGECIVVMATQCINGSVNMNVYDKGRDLLAAGVISGKDMLAETALVKLSWLLGNHGKEEAKRLIGENLRGEIKETIKINNY